MGITCSRTLFKEGIIGCFGVGCLCLKNYDNTAKRKIG